MVKMDSTPPLFSGQIATAHDEGMRKAAAVVKAWGDIYGDNAAASILAAIPKEK